MCMVGLLGSAVILSYRMDLIANALIQIAKAIENKKQ